MHEAGVCVCSQQKHALACTWLFQESVSCLELEICSTFSLTVSFLVEAERATTAAHYKVVTAWPYCVHFRASQSMHTCVSCKPPTSEVSCRFDPSCPHPERQERCHKQSKGAEREVGGGKEKQQGSLWWRVLVQNAFKTEICLQVAEKTQMAQKQRGKRAEKAIEVVDFTITTSLLKYPSGL